MLNKTYSTIRKLLPLPLQSFISKFIFLMPFKPLVKKDNILSSIKFPGGEKGGLIISTDFEMSWAWRYAKHVENYIKYGQLERDNFDAIIKLFEEYQIPITWAIVGHLFLSNCVKGDHDWMKRIPYFKGVWHFDEGDWYDKDPYSNFQDDPEWYAPDLIDKIIKSPISHEIGCHTFSHIDCTYQNCPSDVLEDELIACFNSANKYGLKLTSFVFPGGTAGNYEILKKYGFKIYRKNIRNVDMAYPYYDDYGMLISPSSYAFGDNGLRWNNNYFIFKYKRFIDKAIKTGTIAHFWFHPSIDKKTLEQIIPRVLEEASIKRDQGLLWVGTMKDIANHIFVNNITA